MRASRSPVLGVARWSASRPARRPRALLHRRRHVLWALAAILLLGPHTISRSGPGVGPGAVLAAPPNFSGTWVYQAEADQTAAPQQFRPVLRPTGLCAARCTIAQGAESLTLTRSGADAETVTYRFDGVERQRQRRHPISGEQTIAVATRAVWEGATLVLSSRAATPRPAETRIALSLQDGMLLVESRLDTPGRRTVRRMVYRRGAA
jgi:hypothetical protein